jgi:4-hydroxy-3-methylbut-2-enyl diphosphate reductase
MLQEEARYHPRGFGLKREIEGSLRLDYHSRLVQETRAAGNVLVRDGLTVKLAAEFGFCYGVDRAVEYAYEARARFPGRRLFLIGEIIHNPSVNGRLREMGITFLDPPRPLLMPEGLAGAADGAGDGADPYAALGPDDVVIIPAFGVPVRDLDSLRRRGCILVDTTCGSVLNVWKNVERYGRDAFTSVIHGKYSHEETRATASRALQHPGGHYLVLRDLEEARDCAQVISGEADAAAFAARMRPACSPGFDPALHLQRIGLANQTTMLSSESLELAEILRRAMASRWGEEEAGRRFRAFDTICSATQERQDAVQRLLEEPLGVMLVVGGYNSSNTSHLAEIGSRRVPTFHIEDAESLLSAEEIRHRPVGAPRPVVSRGWLPPLPLAAGLTAGASTPDSKVGEVMQRLAALCGIPLQS